MSFHIATSNRRLYIVRRMSPSSSLYEVLYVSTIAPEAPLSVVADIVRKARPGNQERGITGLLIFDGQRFCQQLEGSQKQVLSLVERIRADPRHTDVHVVHHGALAFLLGINALRASEAAGVRIEDYADTMRGYRVLHLVGKGNRPATMP